MVMQPAGPSSFPSVSEGSIPFVDDLASGSWPEVFFCPFPGQPPRTPLCSLPSVTKESFRYEPVERFGEGLTTRRPWNTSALAGVERLNGRAAMVGFTAAVIGELITGHGPAGQVLGLLRWYLS